MPRRIDLVHLTLPMFVAIVFVLGGGARDDVQSLALLRPLAAAALVVGLWGCTRDQLVRYRVLLIFAALCLLFVLVQLIPLPHALWTLFPGRALADQAGAAAGLDAPWRPFSLVPFRTWNSAFALLVPFAVLLLLVRVPREARYALLPWLIVLGLVSGFIGLLQAAGPPTGPLYFYRVTNDGAAVGLFANRNHQAVLLACLFPMLGAYASSARSIEQARLRGWLALCAGAMLVPLILVTGSRAGLLLGLLALASVALVYRRPRIDRPPARRARGFDPRLILGAAAVLGLGIVTMLMSRARALERFAGGDGAEELRLSIWRQTIDLIGTYFPLGSGTGTFVEVYEADEPRALMLPAYVNHAHNDWLETLLTGGVPAILLIGLAVWFWQRGFRRSLAAPAEAGHEIRFARLGGVIIALLGLASFVDYPLRTPSLAALFVIAAVWLADGGETTAMRSDSTGNRGGR